MKEIIIEGDQLELQSVYDQLTMLIQESRRKVELAINSQLVLLYWNIGMTIKTSILKSQRAEYGKQTIDILSQQLINEYGRGFSRRNLFNMISFYETFPELSIVQSVTAQLTWTHLVELISIKDPL
ncbi:MAG TPA: DUF1016 N-terminal domain-containing protein, partial [Bacillota bacterium]|nr:DUF1016 N-terminal domain-containing protein [Bacillota bacterium]